MGQAWWAEMAGGPARDWTLAEETVFAALQLPQRKMDGLLASATGKQSGELV